MTKLERAIKQAEKIRREKDQAEIINIVNIGVCPICGSKLRRNLSLTGWYQCEQFGSKGFRKDSLKPQCAWQGFTE
jgi:hypothetical protein